MRDLTELRKELQEASTTQKAKASSWFFKTGVGQYGYGDKFIGVTVPEQRAIAKKFKDLSLKDIKSLIQSEIHEERLVALLILVLQYSKADSEKKREIFDFYLSHTKYVNNWDLVDSSADKIIGDFLLIHKKSSLKLLKAIALSDNLWERRIAMIATFQFLKVAQDNKPTFEIADILLEDKNDLIQKAVGWMLRESGKKVSEKELEEYLLTRYKRMGRTALRYAIEKLPEEKRQNYLQGVV